MSALLDAIYARGERTPDSLAIDFGRRSIFHGELRDAIAWKALEIDGVKPRCRGPIAIMIDNDADWVLADLAAMQLGRATVPIPPFFTADQRQRALADAGVTVAVSPGRIVALDHAPVVLAPGTAKISYTSGSTGQPKGLCLSEDLMLATASAVVDRFGEESAGVHLPLLPLAVLLENVAGLYATLLAGGCYAPRRLADVGLADPFAPDAAAMVAAIEMAGATSLILVPGLLAAIVACLETSGARLPALNLVAVGGARVPVSLLERAALVGLPVVQGYGLTECGSVATIEALDETLRGTVGAPLRHVDVSLTADGEIVIAGNGHLGMVGMAREPGPIFTGDIGAFDDDGRLSILGRKSNLIVTSFGRNISPEWIEEALVARPAIAQAMVTGGDDESGLSALIVPASIDADIAGAVAAANPDLPAYARIATWRVSRPFSPVDGSLTPNGRLRREQILARERARPFFDRLVAGTAQARAGLLTVPQLQAGMAGRISRATYLAYLAEAYHHVRHTVPLMRAARERLGHKPNLVAALDDYIAEEDGHEAWILNDIRAGGGDVDRVLQQGPSAATEAMVRHAYATIAEGNPAGFFGMVFVLEGTSVALAQVGADAVRQSLALPPEAFTYLTSHGALDQDHIRFFEKLVNGLDDAEDEAAVMATANAMFGLFGNMFAAIPMEDALETA